MGVFLWWFTWLWWLSNQKAWGNLLRSFLLFVVAFTSKSCMCSPGLHWSRTKGWRVTAPWAQRSDTFRLVALHTSFTSRQTHKQGAVHLSVTSCVDYCPWVGASTGRHKSKHKNTTDIQRMNLFLLPHRPGDPWSRCCSPGKRCIGN